MDPRHIQHVGTPQHWESKIYMEALLLPCIQSDCQQSAQTVSMPGLYVKAASWGVREGKNFVHSQDRGLATGVSIARFQLSGQCARLLGSRALGAHNPHPPADKVLNI